MSKNDFHTIYFESMGHRARIRILESNIDMFLDLMLSKSDLVIVSKEVYYKNLPNPDKVVCKSLHSKSLLIGRCEEYSI